MTTAAIATVSPISAGTLEKVLLDGNLAGLNSAQRIEYMTRVCESLGLNPLTKPFEFLTFQGKMVMYARRDCTEQLRKIHGVSVTIAARETTEGCYVVTARAQDASGRHDESIGAVSIEGLKGEARSNAMMKAETKAKRRVTLSVCGLGMLDESEADSIPGARQATPDYTPPPAKEPAPAAPKDSTTAKAPVPSAVNQARDTVAAAPSAKTYAPANTIKVAKGDKMVSVELGKEVIALAAETLDDSTFRETWLRPYKTHEGVQVASVSQLTEAQAENIRRRLVAQRDRNKARHERGEAEMAGNLTSMLETPRAPTAERAQTPRNLDDEFQRAFENDESEREWVHGLFGVESVKDLDRGQQETALSLILAWNTPLWDETEQKARALGRIR